MYFLYLIYNFCLVIAPQYICCFYTINTLYYMLLLPITEIIFGVQFLSYLAIAHFKFSVEYHICQIRLAKKSAPYLSRILKNSLPSKYHSHLLVEKHGLPFFSWLKIQVGNFMRKETLSQSQNKNTRMQNQFHESNFRIKR